MDTTPSAAVAPVDCACVIHSDGYSWEYVERLYNMLTRNLSRPINFHVYTEPERTVPDHMIKHELTEWPGVAGPKKSWWYKMQLFNSQLFSGQLLYLDLDVVITGNLDWIIRLPTRNFHAIHDFRRLWKPTSRTINSSVMYFNTNTYRYVWE
jgi:lipopolysaccharide biosynthesis glycosyltransferase